MTGARRAGARAASGRREALQPLDVTRQVPALAHRRLIDDLLELFGGSPRPALAHLIETGRLTLADVRELAGSLARLEGAPRAHLHHVRTARRNRIAPWAGLREVAVPQRRAGGCVAGVQATVTRGKSLLRRLPRTPLEGEKAADVLPEELGESLV